MARTLRRRRYVDPLIFISYDNPYDGRKVEGDERRKKLRQWHQDGYSIGIMYYGIPWSWRQRHERKFRTKVRNELHKACVFDEYEVLIESKPLLYSYW